MLLSKLTEFVFALKRIAFHLTTSLFTLFSVEYNQFFARLVTCCLSFVYASNLLFKRLNIKIIGNIINSNRLFQTSFISKRAFLFLLVFSLHFLGLEISAQTEEANTTPNEEPVKTGLKESNDALKSKVIYSADDSMRFDLKNKKIHLYGNADVQYEDIQLKAAYIIIDWDKNELHAEGIPDSLGVIQGTPEFTEGGKTFNAKSMDYNFKTKKGKILNVFTQEGEGYIHGEAVKKNERDEFFIKNAQYTTCNLPDHPHFAINARKIKMIPNNKIISGPAYLELEGLPTPLAVPFGLFPNSTKRKSGIMFPTYGESPGLGFFLVDGGYYFGINDNVDASIRGDIYSRGSWGIKSGMSYNVRYRYNGNFDMRYSNILQGDPELIGSQVNKDFFINWRHAQDPKSNPYTRFAANVQAGTNNYNALNSFNPQNIVTNTFQSSVSLTKTFANSPFSMIANLGHSQNTTTKIINITAPEVQVNMNRVYPFRNPNRIGEQKWYDKIGVTYTMNSRNTIALADSLYGRPGWLNKFQNGIQHQLPIATSFQMLKHFTVSPSINVLARNEFRTIRKRFDEQTGNIVTDTIQGFRTNAEINANAALSTRLYSFLTIGKNVIRHVITPNINFRYQPDYSSRINGFYGPNATPGSFSPFEQSIYGEPSIGERGIIGLALNNNFEAKVKSKRDTTGTGLKKIVLMEVLNFNTSYNIAADSLQLAPLSINARTKLFKKLDLVYSSIYDFYALDPITKQRVNKFEWNENGRIGRLSNASLALTTQLASAQKQTKKTTVANNDTRERELMTAQQYDFVDFDIPWSLNMTFQYNVSRFGDELQSSAIINFYGDLSLTKKWKLGFNSGYDFRQKDFSFSTIDIFRDLHCWEMHFNWIPFGFRRSYNFTIRVKSSMLQDLKLNRRRNWFDQQTF